MFQRRVEAACLKDTARHYIPEGCHFQVLINLDFENDLSAFAVVTEMFTNQVIAAATWNTVERAVIEREII
jgi:hypothetical protein